MTIEVANRSKKQRVSHDDTDMSWIMPMCLARSRYNTSQSNVSSRMNLIFGPYLTIPISQSHRRIHSKCISCAKSMQGMLFNKAARATQKTNRPLSLSCLTFPSSDRKWCGNIASFQVTEQSSEVAIVVV